MPNVPVREREYKDVRIQVQVGDTVLAVDGVSVKGMPFAKVSPPSHARSSVRRVRVYGAPLRLDGGGRSRIDVGVLTHCDVGVAFFQLRKRLLGPRGSCITLSFSRSLGGGPSPGVTLPGQVAAPRGGGTGVVGYSVVMMRGFAEPEGVAPGVEVVTEEGCGRGSRDGAAVEVVRCDEGVEEAGCSPMGGRRGLPVCSDLANIKRRPNPEQANEGLGEEEDAREGRGLGGGVEGGVIHETVKIGGREIVLCTGLKGGESRAEKEKEGKKSSEAGGEGNVEAGKATEAKEVASPARKGGRDSAEGLERNGGKEVPSSEPEGVHVDGGDESDYDALT